MRLKEGIVVKQIEGEGIVVDANTGRYLAPNRVALEMITAMMESDDLEEVIIRLMNIMDVDRHTLEVDIKTFSNRLAELRLICSEALY